MFKFITQSAPFSYIELLLHLVVKNVNSNKCYERPSGAEVTLPHAQCMWRMSSGKELQTRLPNWASLKIQHQCFLIHSCKQRQSVMADSMCMINRIQYISKVVCKERIKDIMKWIMPVYQKCSRMHTKKLENRRMLCLHIPHLWDSFRSWFQIRM